MENRETNETKTPDDLLLEDVLNELDITFEDEQIKKKIADILRRGKARIEYFAGESIDFHKNMQARELLFSYCRYGRSNAIGEFEHDFLSQITAFSIEMEIQRMKGKEESNEKTV